MRIQKDSFRNFADLSKDFPTPLSLMIGPSYEPQTLSKAGASGAGMPRAEGPGSPGSMGFGPPGFPGIC